MQRMFLLKCTDLCINVFKAVKLLHGGSRSIYGGGGVISVARSGSDGGSLFHLFSGHPIFRASGLVVWAVSSRFYVVDAFGSGSGVSCYVVI